jgi:ABC-type oligopeptide transport system ATPase subunit
MVRWTRLRPLRSSASIERFTSRGALAFSAVGPILRSMPDCILRASRLTKIVTSGDAPLTILDDVGFDIDSGDTVAVVGASGSGKTTLLGLLAGLDGRSDGDVWLDGNALSGLDEDARAALRQRCSASSSSRSSLCRR